VFPFRADPASQPEICWRSPEFFHIMVGEPGIYCSQGRIHIKPAGERHTTGVFKRLELLRANLE
jgi:hypothetical protein